MNAEAQKLQAFDTVAKTPNGLDKKGQTSSAYDLALIARAGLALPDFKRYVSTKTAKFPAPKGKSYEIGNHNKLLWRYNGMIGVKNGWTSKALGSFVGAATRNGHTIIVTIMRHDGAFWDDVSKLMDWGFAVRGTATPVGTLVAPGAAPSTQPSALTLAPVTPAPSGPAAAGLGTDASTAPGLAATLVLGTGMVGGLAWIGYGLRRRRRHL
jgi:D-alanyl-D-alanine carboxypeptidase (penicillin-binding protein 5/6)